MKPLVIAHRGACWDAPENTIEAFELAIDQGADYVEFDVRPTRDGTLVCAHDPVGRDLRPGTPTLAETLEALRGRIGVAVEIKHYALTSRTLQALEHFCVPPDETIIVSFHRRAIETTGALRPDLRTIQHVARVPLRWAAANAWGAGFWDPRATRRRIARAQALGLATSVYTVNDPGRMRELSDLGVTAIFTDRPALLRETLAAAA
jgi:glycerophosphoryl diester phosphodiesterase